MPSISRVVTVESSSRLNEANVRPRLALEIGKLILVIQTFRC